MKSGNSHKMRGKKRSFAFIAIVICTTIALCAWEKTPVMTTFRSPPDRFDTHLTMTPSRDEHQQQFSSDVQSEQSTEEVPSGSFNEENITDLSESSGHVTEKEVEEVLVPPLRISNLNTSEEISDGFISGTAFQHKKECNYAKGRWVADSRRPLYSGFACKQWLSDMWACRLTNRKDFSFENYRWQPEGCDMPEFDGSEFLKRMQHKTIALVGDSLGRQQFQSLMCMVTGGKENLEVENIGRQYGLTKPKGAKRPDGWAYRFPTTNTTILYYWSATLCELEPLNVSDPLTRYAMHLDRPALFLKQHVHKFDVIVLNTGHHWNRGKVNANRWEMYVDGKPNTNRRIAEIWNAKNLTVRSVATWLDTQKSENPKLRAFLRTISPRHFVNGDWNTGGSCDNTTPLLGGSKVMQDNSSDPVIAGAVVGTKVKLLDITALSQLRDEGHMSRYSIMARDGIHDCLHWCLPGIPDTWNEILAAQI